MLNPEQDDFQKFMDFAWQRYLKVIKEAYYTAYGSFSREEDERKREIVFQVLLDKMLPTLDRLEQEWILQKKPKIFRKGR